METQAKTMSPHQKRWHTHRRRLDDLLATLPADLRIEGETEDEAAAEFARQCKMETRHGGWLILPGVGSVSQGLTELWVHLREAGWFVCEGDVHVITKPSGPPKEVVSLWSQMKAGTDRLDDLIAHKGSIQAAVVQGMSDPAFCLGIRYCLEIALGKSLENKDLFQEWASWSGRVVDDRDAPLAAVLCDEDPDTLALARFALEETLRRGWMKEGVTLEKWMADAIYERAMLVLQVGILDQEEVFIASHRPCVSNADHSRRTLYLKAS